MRAWRSPYIKIIFNIKHVYRDGDSEIYRIKGGGDGKMGTREGVIMGQSLSIIAREEIKCPEG